MGLRSRRGWEGTGVVPASDAGALPSLFLSVTPPARRLGTTWDTTPNPAMCPEFLVKLFSFPLCFPQFLSLIHPLCRCVYAYQVAQIVND